MLSNQEHFAFKLVMTHKWVLQENLKSYKQSKVPFIRRINNKRCIVSKDL